MKPLSQNALNGLARWFGLLSEPMRLRIIGELQVRTEASVLDLAERLEAPLVDVSMHLEALHETGIVSCSGDTPVSHYRLADPGVLRACELALAMKGGPAGAFALS